ncbi:MAG: ABC transporter permease [Firmicutes bacterium]|nr:ABC transporter permease [Bacillota bacterium]MCM1400402.1 ABC transporter permease [Bacteroides sp.]MCM1477159.1 ABC transporter permease [Bacteroides sp.]
MKQSVVWHLLRRNISKGQLFGYAAANLIGLCIVISAIQLYRDVTSVWNAEDSFISRDYLIVSKQVNGLGSILTGRQSAFSAKDIEEIKEQPWVRRVGEFTASNFGVAASVDIGGRGMSTAMFLEAIPDEFFDVKPDQWHFTPGPDAMVPVIISKEYLSLYNFGFAASRGLPQISESMIGMVPLRLSVSGNGKQMWLPAKIVGFSSRLNTIAVPQEFMTWANTNFSDQPQPNPSRLIIETNSPGDPAIDTFMRANHYEVAGDKVDNGRAAYFLAVITAVVVAVGAIISLLAFFILLLSIYLLLQKNREKLRQLMMLGYSPAAVAAHYYRIVCIINGAVLLGAVAAMLVAKHLWSEPLDNIGVDSGSPWVAILIGVIIMAVITAGNIIAISRNVNRNFPSPRQ